MGGREEKRGCFTSEERRGTLDILKKLKALCRHSGNDIFSIERAYNFANEKHNGVRRKDGSPYINHCLEVACNLAKMERSTDEIMAGILHDTVEDTDTTLQDLEENFNKKVAQIVNAVTNIERELPNDCELQKDEIDELSDTKLIKSILLECPEALFVKVADRLHNLSTMESVDDKRRINKVKETRAILIPLIREFAYAHSLADRLEDACLKAEQPKEYWKLREKYRKHRKENGTHIPHVGAYMVHELSGNIGCRVYVTNCCIRPRSMYSIHQDLVAMGDHNSQLLDNFTLRNIPLTDVFFVVQDECPMKPEEVFIDLYDDLRLHQYVPQTKYGRNEFFNLTIVGFGTSVNSNLRYFIMADCYEVRYRVFCEREKDYKVYLHGYGIEKLKENGKRLHVGPSAPAGALAPQITVYTRKYESKKIEQGATVLDFAFMIHPKLAFGAKYAYLNDQEIPMPLNTKLNHGDKVVIISTTSNEATDNDATEDYGEDQVKLYWENWVNTKKARRALTNHLMRKFEDKITSIGVIEAESNKEYELTCDAHPLDLAFAAYPAEKAICFKEAFLNKSKVACAVDRKLIYGDKVRLKFGDEPNPSFEWIRYVKTEVARNALIDYFKDKIKD